VIGWAEGGGGGGHRGSNSNHGLMTEPPGQDSKVLFVGNLPASVTEEEVSGLFADCGVVSVKHPKERGYAFVEFASTVEARRAMAQSGERELMLQQNVLMIGWAKGRAADASTQSAECWFCLASPVVKVSLKN
jgi:RNA recognition motif-containing protein